MRSKKLAAVLIGHGGVPSDYPREKIQRLMALERARQAWGAAPTAQEEALDREVRCHPRTPETDPYKFGFERLAAALAARLDDRPLYTAYNEFCAPSVPAAVADAIRQGATEITLLSAMMTPGGSHAEVEIPELAARLQRQNPSVTIRYAWPFDLDTVASVLEQQLRGWDRQCDEGMRDTLEAAPSAEIRERSRREDATSPAAHEPRTD